MNDLNVLPAQLSGKAAELNDEIAIMKTCEGICRNVEVEELDFIAQDARWVQAGDVHLVVAVFVEQPGELDGLKLRAPLMKAANEL
jgi:hypothetical protein